MTTTEDKDLVRFCLRIGLGGLLALLVISAFVEPWLWVGVLLMGMGAIRLKRWL